MRSVSLIIFAVSAGTLVAGLGPQLHAQQAKRPAAALIADEMAGRAAMQAGNAALQKGLAAGSTVEQAWEEAALAAGRAASEAQLAAGRTQAAARLAAQQAEEQVRAQAPKAQAGKPNKIRVEMSVAVSATNPPTITGMTNLPDGTGLRGNLISDQPCAPNCYAEAQTVVQNGRFVVSSESIRGKIAVGPYTIELITLGAAHQPASVQSVIGPSGEHLDGPYVVTLSKQGYAPRSANPSEFEKAMGYQIRYVQKVGAARVGPPAASWRRIEADNGAVYAIDMNSISHNTNGTALAITCVVENDTCPLLNMSRFHFDCRGHYQDLDRRGPVMPAPPRSVAGRMAAFACAGAKDTRFRDNSDQRPTPAEYCQGFPRDACARITAMVNGQAPMPPCQPGYGLVGSGYTREQIRACSVRGILPDAQQAR
ncbi:MAG: hypothetical protein K2Y71_29615 [Xanthobacteraceae bacterium]|nr:hypothetical protein [Xanthobacteraceae bacterium]